MKITDALKAEHTIYLSVFQQIERVLPSMTTLVEVRNMGSIVEQLLKNHARREAELAFSALDHVLAENGQLARFHQDHREIDARLNQVQIAQTCAEGRRLLKGAINASREHFQLEERHLVPFMESVLAAETLEELGQVWIERMPTVALRA